MANPMGYTFEVVGQTLKECECAICLMLIKEAIELPCTHCFCKLCILRNEKEHARNGVYSCPTCKQQYSLEKKRDNKALDRIILTSLDVKCLQVNRNCDWIGCIDDYQDHIDNRCKYIPIKCTNKGCNVLSEKRSTGQHQTICAYRDVYCGYCQLQIQYIHRIEHHEICPLVEVKCKNDKCSEIMKRQEVERHYKEDCKYETINCIFKDNGCNATFLREKQTDHNNQAIHHHMFFMLQNQTVLAEKNQALEIKTQQMTSQIAEDHEKMQSLTAQIADDHNKIELLETDLKINTEMLTQQNKKINELEKLLKVAELQESTVANSERTTEHGNEISKTIDNDVQNLIATLLKHGK